MINCEIFCVFSWPHRLSTPKVIPSIIFFYPQKIIAAIKVVVCGNNRLTDTSFVIFMLLIQISSKDSTNYKRGIQQSSSFD